MSITTNMLRVGNFTSSEIVSLVSCGKTKDSFGKPFYTYIEEKNFERDLGRSLDDEVNSRPLLWGKLLEKRAFDILPTSYSLSSQETIAHPLYSNWVGSRDGLNKAGETAVIDIKCPFTLKSFCQLVKPLYDGLLGIEAINWIRENHKDGEKYYWQLVSNAIISQVNFAELIVYMPYKSESLAISEMIDDLPIDELSNYYFIKMARENDLPFLIEGRKYKNINIIRFEVPKEDKLFLTNRVIEASKLLSPPLQSN